MKIRVLAEETINKIAAGEVVERPSSIVKELIENSIDAGADRIDVEIKAGGKNLIRVTDSGCGMDKDDAVLAFGRHATSKINNADDLTRISTLGFRGEALPSIAAVSKVELITRAKDMESAIKVRVEGNKILEVKETGAPCGTVVSVQNLFFNTPARRKFLKTNNTELTHIINTISNYCLMYADCGFSLIHNMENIIEIFSRDALLDRIRLLYGNEIAEGVLGLDFEKGGIKLKGYVGKPTITYPNRSNQFIFVNKRPIVSRIISYAIYDAYNTLIPKGRAPVVFLFLEIPPESMDVNVHPTKKEVRFSDDRFVQEVVKEGILGALKPQVVPIMAGSEFRYTSSSKPLNSWGVQEVMPSFERAGLPQADKITQMNKAYIINELEDGFEIMDQHAVHERILYERIKSSLSEKAQESQRLLIPVNIELTPNEEKILKEELPFLKELGFNIEEFGSRAIIVDMIPAIMDRVDINGFIKDVLNEIMELEKAVSQDGVKDGIIKLMACRSAVKQGDELDNLEMQRILREWHKTKMPYTCPHGRPAVVKMSWEELEKKFHRR